jgi:hypothetical protein
MFYMRRKIGGVADEEAKTKAEPPEEGPNTKG